MTQSCRNGGDLVKYDNLTKEELLEKIKEFRYVEDALKKKELEVVEVRTNLTEKLERLESEYNLKLKELEIKQKDSIKEQESIYINQIKEFEKKIKNFDVEKERFAEAKLLATGAGYKNDNDKMLKDLVASEKNNKIAVDLIHKQAVQLEEALEIINSIHRSFQGSLDMSISLSQYFKNKVTGDEK